MTARLSRLRLALLLALATVAAVPRTSLAAAPAVSSRPAVTAPLALAAVAFAGVHRNTEGNADAAVIGVLVVVRLPENRVKDDAHPRIRATLKSASMAALSQLEKACVYDGRGGANYQYDGVRYMYVNGDPVNLVDPTGHTPCEEDSLCARDRGAPIQVQDSVLGARYRRAPAPPKFKLQYVKAMNEWALSDDRGNCHLSTTKDPISQSERSCYLDAKCRQTFSDISSAAALAFFCDCLPDGVEPVTVGAAEDLPAMTIDDVQFGTKIGKHARDYGLDPADPASRDYLRSLITDVRMNADEVRVGPWHPTGGGGDRYVFFRQGSDVVVTQPNGSLSPF